MDADPFADLAAQLDMEEPDVEDLSKVSSFQLRKRLECLDVTLSETKELLHPRTQRARELHSERGAIVVVLKKRGAL